LTIDTISPRKKASHIVFLSLLPQVHSFSDYTVRQANTINEAPVCVCMYVCVSVSPVALLGFNVCLICPRGKWTHSHVDSYDYTQRVLS